MEWFIAARCAHERIFIQRNLIDHDFVSAYRSSVVGLPLGSNSMKKFAIALAVFISLGLASPAFAQEKKEMPAEKMGVHHHHHHHHHHHMMKPEPKQ